MDPVNIHQAKANLSRLIERVESGEEIVIARAGRPVARLVPIVWLREPRRPGAWRGQVRIAPDFDVTPSDMLGALGGATKRYGM